MIGTFVACTTGVAAHMMRRQGNLVLGLQEQSVTGIAESEIPLGMCSPERNVDCMF